MSSSNSGNQGCGNAPDKISECRQAIVDLIEDEANVDAQLAMHRVLQEFMVAVIERYNQQRQEAAARREQQRQQEQQQQQQQQQQGDAQSGSASSAGTCTCECKCGRK